LLSHEGIIKSINVPNHEGKTPLDIAQSENRIQVMIMLIRKGADFSKHLEWAISNESQDLISAMILAGASLTDSLNDLGHRILHLAALKGWNDVVDACITKHADINIHTADKWIPIHFAARDGHVNIIKKLLENGSQIDAAQEYGYTALHLAVHNNRAKVVETLLSYEGIALSINAKNNEGKRALDIAFMRENIALMALLVKGGADYSGEFGEKKQTLFKWAISRNMSDLVSALVTKGEGINQKLTQYGDTILHIAAHHNWVNVINACIDKKMDVNVENTGKWTPLHYAVRKSYHDSTFMLLGYGADCNARAIHNLTPLGIAVAHDALFIAELLIERGAKFSKEEIKQFSSESSHTLLHRAAKVGLLEVLPQLEDLGLEWTAKDYSGNTPLHYAARYAPQRTSLLLLKAPRAHEAVSIKNHAGDVPCDYVYSDSALWKDLRVLMKFHRK
jgi:ankyrin repeat protein